MLKPGCYRLHADGVAFVSSTRPRVSADGESFERSSVTFITGIGFDKYRKERSYNPAQRGTFWGKLRARHRALTNLTIRWINGFAGQALNEMEIRHFIIDSVDGPRPDGTFAIVAKDILKLADGERSQTPALTNGYLLAALASNGDSFVAGFTGGFSNAQYPTATHCLDRRPRDHALHEVGQYLHHCRSGAVRHLGCRALR